MSQTTDTNPEWHGEDVTIRDVLTALTEIRNTFAHTEAGDDEHPHPRNCVMTLVTVATNDSEERLAVRTSQAISSQHPAQAIVIREDPAAPGHHLDAWITTEVQRPEMSCATECENASSCLLTASNSEVFRRSLSCVSTSRA